MTIDKKGISNIARDNRSVINIDIVNIIYNVYTFTLTRVCRFNDPYVFLRVMLLKFLIVSIKVAKLIR